PNGFPLWSGRSPAPVTTAGFVQQLAQLSLECRVNATRNYINIHESRRVRRARVTIPLGCGSAALGESRADRAGWSDRNQVPGFPSGSRVSEGIAPQFWLRASTDVKSILLLIM